MFELRRDDTSDIARQFVQSAFSFLDGAAHLTATMVAGHFTSDVDHGDIVLWLAFHALELFCKPDLDS
jgi:hypothetical protein